MSPSATDLTAYQLNALVVTERVNSVISLIGIFFVLITYVFCASFDKPINRLIFFATWSNLGVNVASLISGAGPQAAAADGYGAPLCQIQGFLVQFFLGVDAYWAFCMAINVYLAFFRDWSVSRLRTLDIRYLLICYGASFIPAIIFLFIQSEERGRVYGPAVIWCWISIKWDFLRIVILYAIVWIAIVFASIIYLMAARNLWLKRKYLDGFMNPLNENPFTNIVTTEIEITHETRPIVEHGGHNGGNFEHGKGIDTMDVDPYSVTVHTSEAKSVRQLPEMLRMRSITREVANKETNPEAWLYGRVAFLFFLALMVTWIPSSVNRVYSLASPDKVNFGLNYVASFVFPLQGFWNAVVYIITSRTACRKLWDQAIMRRRGPDRMGSTQNLTGSQNQKRDRFGSFGKDRHRLESLSSFSNDR